MRPDLKDAFDLVRDELYHHNNGVYCFTCLENIELCTVGEARNALARIEAAIEAMSKWRRVLAWLGRVYLDW